MLHPVSCQQKNAGVPWWAFASAGKLPIGAVDGQLRWRFLRDDRQLKARTSCISAPAAASGMWIFLLENMDLYTFSKKKLGP